MRGVRAALILALALFIGTASKAAADDPSLQPIDLEAQEVGGVDGMRVPFGVELSADGDHVYTSSWYTPRIATFAREPTTGSLTYVGATGTADDEGSINSMVASPRGHDLYALTSGGISTFSTDTQSGEPTLRQSITPRQIPALGGGFDVTVAPDLKQIYVASLYDRIIVFDRLRSGRLRFARTLAPFGRETYGVLQAVEVTPDGRSLYASRCSEAGPNLGVFRRSTRTGGIRPLQRLRTPESNPDGVDCMRGIAASRSGVAVAASRYGVLGYSRDPRTGRLDFRNRVSDVAGRELFDPWDVSDADSGRTIFVTTTQTSQLLQLSMVRGRLTLLGFERDGQAGVTAMANPHGVAADDSNVYVTSFTDSALTAFARLGSIP